MPRAHKALMHRALLKTGLVGCAGIRASQNLVLGGKVRALLRGRYNVSFGDIRALAPSVLRHRVLLNFHAEAERITTDEVVRRLLEAVPEPKSEL